MQPPRLARIAVVNVAHDVTQRGNARQFILANDDERKVYLSLLRKYVELCDLSLLGYCLMSSHVHLLVVPRKSDSLARALKQTHGRYASYWNATHRSIGRAATFGRDDFIRARWTRVICGLHCVMWN